MNSENILLIILIIFLLYILFNNRDNLENIGNDLTPQQKADHFIAIQEDYETRIESTNNPEEKKRLRTELENIFCQYYSCAKEHFEQI